MTGSDRFGNSGVRIRSGEFSSSDTLVNFIYLLLRDHLPAGVIEKILQEHIEVAADEVLFSNGWLAQYAHDVAERLRGSI